MKLTAFTLWRAQVKRRILEAWGYIVEILLSGSIVSLAILALGKDKFFEVVVKIAHDFASIFCGVMFAGSIALLALFLTKTSSPFLKWLRHTGAYLTYLRSTIYPCAIFATTIVFSILVKSSQFDELILPLALLIFLSLTNAYTLLINMYELVKLGIAFGRVIEENRPSQKQI